MIRIDIFVVFYSLYIKLYSRAKKLLEEIFKIIFNLAVDVEVINANVVQQVYFAILILKQTCANVDVSTFYSMY